ncbi:MAG: hypothetical protein IJ685_02565 [Selenomonadaceae bacterium]|nr:hypothetical protein [Selenomonadaceae bacterium]
MARGVVGTIITGFTSVSADDFYFGGMMRLSDNKLIPQYKKLVEIIHENDCAAISQLALGAFYKNGFEVGENEMTLQDVREVINFFVNAAIRAEICGFDGVQIHAAHFFFLSRFISPKINCRTDEFSGSTENRAKILLEILSGIKKSTKNLHVTIKINSNDFVAGIKSGVNEGYFADFAAKLAENVDVPIICVGGFRSRDFMEKILRETKIELISLSRPLVREPNLPKKFFDGSSDVSKCISCNSCYRTPAYRCIFGGRA